MIVGGRRREESFVRSGVRDRFSWAQVDEMSGNVHGLSPKPRRHRGLNQKGTNDVVSSPNGALGLAILGRGIGAGKSEESTMREKKSTIQLVIKFPTVVTLDVSNF
jgi:hypothetical protein